MLMYDLMMKFDPGELILQVPKVPKNLMFRLETGSMLEVTLLAASYQPAIFNRPSISGVEHFGIQLTLIGHDCSVLVQTSRGITMN